MLKLVCLCLALSAIGSEALLQKCSLYCGDEDQSSATHRPSTSVGGRGKAGPKGEKGEVANCHSLRQHFAANFTASNAEMRRLEGELNSAKEKIRKLERKAGSCLEIKRDDPSAPSGVYDIYQPYRPPRHSGEAAPERLSRMSVYCDMDTDGGGWTTFQRREDGIVNFFRGWHDYVDGFGDLNGEFWMGLQALHRMTQDGSFEFRADLEAWDGSKAHAHYRSFSIGEGPGFILHVEGYSGDAGEDGLHRHNGMKFSTYDRDQDRHQSVNCAESYKGAFWYNRCHVVNVNGIYYQKVDSPSIATGVNWHPFKPHSVSLRFTELKFRPN